MQGINNGGGQRAERASPLQGKAPATPTRCQTTTRVSANCKQSDHGQIFIQLRPVNSNPAANQAALSARRG